MSHSLCFADGTNRDTITLSATLCGIKCLGIGGAFRVSAHGAILVKVKGLDQASMALMSKKNDY